MQTNLDLYTDYLISSFGQTSATNLSRLIDEQISHDDASRFLSQPRPIRQTLWKQVKPLVRQHQHHDGVLVVDDSLLHKPYSQPNGLVSTYFDHTTNQYVKAINFLSLLYRVGDILLPVGFHLVVKYLQSQIKDRKEIWKAIMTKNEAFCELLHQVHQNAIPFRYVLADSWYTNAENVNAVLAIDKHWLGAFKTNLGFTDGRTLPFDVILKATDYRPGLEAMLGEDLSLALLNEKGYPKSLWFEEPARAGLYFLGFKTPLTGILNNINQDSALLINHLGQNNLVTV